MRSDLPLGVLVAQAVHAAAESVQGTEPGTHVVVLSVPDEYALLKIEQKLLQHDVRHITFREPDMGGQATAVGLFPVRDRTEARKLLGKLPLLGGEPWRST